MGLVYAILGWLIGSALILMVARRAWWEWDSPRPHPRPVPIIRPARTQDRLVRALHAHDEEEAEAHA